MNQRIRAAARERVQEVNPRLLEEIQELGRRLLYISAAEEVKFPRQPLWSDDPRLLVAKLEASAEGCRWLLARWAEFRILLDRGARWDTPALLRFIRLQGKQVAESVYDPVLNVIFVAWDVLVPNFAAEEWRTSGKSGFGPIPPSTTASAGVRSLPAPATRPSAGGARHDHRGPRREPQGAAGPQRGHRSGRGLRLGRLRGAGFEPWVRAAPALPVGQDPGAAADAGRAPEIAECGFWNREWGKGEWQMPGGGWQRQMASDGCQVAEGEPQVAGDELKMGDEQCEVEAGGCDQGQSSEPMTEGSSGPIVGHDSTHVIDDSTNDKNGILSYEGAQAAGQPGQGDGIGQCLPDDVTTPQKVPNKANLESKQELESQELKSEMAGAEGRKQSQSSQGGTTEKAEVARWPTGLAEWPAAGGQ